MVTCNVVKKYLKYLFKSFLQLNQIICFIFLQYCEFIHCKVQYDIFLCTEHFSVFVCTDAYEYRIFSLECFTYMLEIINNPTKMLGAETVCEKKTVHHPYQYVNVVVHNIQCADSVSYTHLDVYKRQVVQNNFECSLS